MDEPVDRDDVKSLLDQLKETNKIARDVDKQPFSLPKEQLEQFILDNTGRLIKDSMDTIDSIKDFIVSAPEPEDVHSLAELYKASTGAIEALNKILIQQQKAAAQITVKTMDIQAKQAIAENKSDTTTFTREEIMKSLIESGSVTMIEEIEAADQDSDTSSDL
jgi:hypothetical protein